MKLPGDLTPEEQQAVFDRIRAQAVERWGADRAMALETNLRDAAIAVGRLERLRFSRDDAPGFFLSDKSLGVHHE